MQYRYQANRRAWSIFALALLEELSAQGLPTGKVVRILSFAKRLADHREVDGDAECLNIAATIVKRLRSTHQAHKTVLTILDLASDLVLDIRDNVSFSTHYEAWLAMPARRIA